IVMIEMDDVVVEVVGPERTVRAARLPLRQEHEVIDDELTAAVEEIGQRLLSVRAVEKVVLLHTLPRQLAAAAAQLIALPREFLFLRQQLLARGDPLVV